MNGEQRTALVTVLTMEREIAALAADSLQQWLHAAQQVVLPVFTAAAAGQIPPDPDAIVRTAPAWEHQIDNGFMGRFAAILDRLLGEERGRLGEWRTRYLSSVRIRLLTVPAAAVRRVQAAIRGKVGQSVAVLRELAARALDYAASWRDDADRIGRDEAVAAFNAVRLAAAELEQSDTGTPLDKMWLCLHDDRTRSTHRHADRQRVPLGATFVVGDSQLQYPHDPDGPPEEVIGCRCVITILNSALEDPAPARVASAADTGGTTMARSFEALLIPTGVPGRSQGWMLAANVELVDSALPLALKWQRTADPGHDGAYTVAVLETVQLRDGAVWGTGVMLDSPEAAEAIQQIEASVTRPSIELVARSSVLTDTAGSPITPDTAEQMLMDGAQVMSRIDIAEIVAATLVSVPEFRDAHMTLGDEMSDADNARGLALVAAAARVPKPDIYPAAFFQNPQLTEPTPIHVTSDGHVLGHLACWETMHTAYPDMEVTPRSYRSYSGYAYFHQSAVHLDDDQTLSVGRLTVGGGHGVAGLGMRAALEHYDDVTTCWAKVRAGEDDIGIWVSGAIEANASEQMVKLALDTPHSGHWERVGGHPELLIGHAVNAPGFPIPAAQRLRDRDGDLALVASFAPRAARPPVPTSLLEDIARRGAQAYAEQLAAAQRAAAARQLVLVASSRRRTLGEVIRASHAARTDKAS